MKTCKTCGQCKPLSEFYRAIGNKDGHRSNCKACKDKTTVLWRELNRDHYNAIGRKANRRRYPISRLQRYGLTPEDHARMLTEQDGKCAICKEPPKGKRPLAVDHDHHTGKIRGLLCYGCNRALHTLDNLKLFDAALNYLARKR